MRPLLVVVGPPMIDALLGIFYVQKPMLVQALLTKPTVERFNIRIVRRFSRSAEIQFHFIEVSPPVQALRDELWAVVHTNRFRMAPLLGDCFQERHDIITSKPLPNLDCQIYW